MCEIFGLYTHTVGVHNLNVFLIMWVFPSSNGFCAKQPELLAKQFTLVPNKIICSAVYCTQTDIPE